MLQNESTSYFVPMGSIDSDVASVAYLPWVLREYIGNLLRYTPHFRGDVLSARLRWDLRWSDPSPRNLMWPICGQSSWGDFVMVQSLSDYQTPIMRKPYIRTPHSSINSYSSHNSFPQLNLCCFSVEQFLFFYGRPPFLHWNAPPPTGRRGGWWCNSMNWFRFPWL